jgi:diguanylate cyclase (GGDEF)-like protein
MSDMAEIIDLCSSISGKAGEIYLDLSNGSQSRELKRFWKSMSDEEEGHVAFWKELLVLAGEGKVQQIFDNPGQVKEELRFIILKVEKLREQKRVLHRVSDAFIIAYRLEFYTLHPAFERLFHFMSGFSSNAYDPEIEYEAHINKLIVACDRYGKTTPDIELLGETIHRLWTENKRLAIQSDIDFLTGIYNRRGLFRILRTLSFLAQRNGDNVGIMMIDIDGFKRINDTYGHQKGDEVIRAVANVIRSNIRASDIVGRYGGEEFLVFLSKVSREYFYDVAEKIRHVVEKESKKDVPVTVSLGIAQEIIEKDVERELEALIKKADSCLLNAKTTAKNMVVMCGGNTSRGVS